MPNKIEAARNDIYAYLDKLARTVMPELVTMPAPLRAQTRGLASDHAVSIQSTPADITMPVH